MTYPPYPGAGTPGDPYGAQPAYPPPGQPYGGQPDYGGQPGYPPQGQPPYGQHYGDQPGYPPPPYGGQPGYPPGPPFGGRPLPVNDPLISPDYGGWWSRGMAIVKVAWRPILALQAGAALIGVVLQAIPAVWSVISFGSSVESASSSDLGRLLGEALGIVALTLITALIAGLASLVAYVASIHVAVATAIRQPVDIGAALRGALRRLAPLMGWGFVAFLIIIAGILLCFLPGLYAAAALCFLPAVVAFERGEVIGRCFRLFHADLGASLARVATVAGIYLGAGLVTNVMSRILGVVGASSDSTGVEIVTTVADLVFTGAITAGVAIFTVPLLLGAYADMRARLDGDINAGRLAAELAS